VNLQTTVLTSPRGSTISFVVNPTRRFQLLEGLDDLDVGLRRRDQIKAFQQADRRNCPWVYDVPALRSLSEVGLTATEGDQHVRSDASWRSATLLEASQARRCDPG
jgi:hypothetical protein